jgi:hypothetical protein
MDGKFKYSYAAFCRQNVISCFLWANNCPAIEKPVGYEKSTSSFFLPFQLVGSYACTVSVISS